MDETTFGDSARSRIYEPQQQVWEETAPSWLTSPRGCKGVTQQPQLHHPVSPFLGPVAHF
jgi:hypothetical protein